MVVDEDGDVADDLPKGHHANDLLKIVDESEVGIEVRGEIWVYE